MCCPISDMSQSEPEQIVLYYVEGEGEEEDEGVQYSVAESQQEVDGKVVFKCQFCPSTFDRELGLYGHLNSHKVILSSLQSNMKLLSQVWVKCPLFFKYS